MSAKEAREALEVIRATAGAEHGVTLADFSAALTVLTKELDEFDAFRAAAEKQTHRLIVQKDLRGLPRVGQPNEKDLVNSVDEWVKQNPDARVYLLTISGEPSYIELDWAGEFVSSSRAMDEWHADRESRRPGLNGRCECCLDSVDYSPASYCEECDNGVPLGDEDEEDDECDPCDGCSVTHNPGECP